MGGGVGARGGQGGVSESQGGRGTCGDDAQGFPR